VDRIKKALITGVTSQDGISLAKLLEEKDYQVFGLTRSLGTRSTLLKRVAPKTQVIEVKGYGMQHIHEIIAAVRPAEIYNLAAISSVKKSFDFPKETKIANFSNFVDLISSIEKNKLSSDVKIFQASSSEMFGNSSTSPQNEETELNGISPYAESKILAHKYSEKLRKSGLHISSGIMFNHESEYRTAEFLSRKIVNFVAEYREGQKERLKLGNIEVSRDWGYAGDYVYGMWLSLQQEYSDSYVFSTGVPHTVLDFLRLAMCTKEISKDPLELISIDEELKRPIEKYASLGDFSKAKKSMGWEPKISFEQMIKIMVEYEIKNGNDVHK
jgi:GDPmannose 4,6-dehydratase